MRDVPKTSAPEQGTLPFLDLDDELAALRDEVVRLRVENARLLRLLELTPREARPPGPVQTGVFDAAPGPVHVGSPAAAKVAFFATLFTARPDVYALRWENARSGRSGWTPAVQGGWRKGVPAAEREYLPLTEEVITAHLSGDLELGLYPMLDGDRCRWLAADFDGATALLDALAYLKAVRAADASAALEVSRSGLGAHVWLLFTAPVPAATARQVGSGLLRGDRGARTDGPGQLRPALSLPGRPGGRWAGQSHRRAAAGPRPPPRGHGVSGPGHAGAARGPVGLPVHPRPAHPERGHPARAATRPGQRRRRGRPAPLPHLHQDRRPPVRRRPRRI